MTPEKLRYLRGLISPKSNREISPREDYKHIEAFSPEKFKQVMEGTKYEVSLTYEDILASDTSDLETICHDFVTLYQNIKACFKAKTPEEYDRALENYCNYEVTPDLEADGDEYDVPSLELDTNILIEDSNHYNWELMSGAFSAYTWLLLRSLENQGENIDQTAKECLNSVADYTEQKANDAVRNGVSLNFSQRETNMLLKQTAEFQKQAQTASEKMKKWKNYTDYIVKKMSEFYPLTTGQLQTMDCSKDPFVKDVYKICINYLKEKQKGRTDTKAFDRMKIDRFKNLR